MRTHWFISLHMPMPNVHVLTVQHCVAIVKRFCAGHTVKGCCIVEHSQNQCTSLVDAGIGSNPIYYNFYGLFFEVDFYGHPRLQLT